MQLSKEDYARKIIHNGCSVRIENSVNQDNYYASLGNLAMPNSYPRDRIFNPHLTAIKDSYYKDTYENVWCSNIYYTWIWDTFCPYLCYIRKCNMAEPVLRTKIWYLVPALFLHMKMCNVYFTFTFFRIWTAAYQNVPKGSRVSFTCF